MAIVFCVGHWLWIILTLTVSSWFVLAYAAWVWFGIILLPLFIQPMRGYHDTLYNRRERKST